MLSANNLTDEVQNKAVHFLPADDPDVDDDLQVGETISPQHDMSVETEKGESANDDGMDEKGIEAKAILVSSEQPSSGRKRSRIKSGGESGPLPKKALNRKSSLDNLFRCRTNSVDAFWRNRCSKSANTTGDPQQEDSDCVLSPKTESEHNSDFFFVGNHKLDKLFPPNHQAKYGSISVPLYVYDCSLSVLTEHIIFRSISGQKDTYIDRRVSSKFDAGSVDSSSFNEDKELSKSPRSPVKHISPEPKSEEQELPASKILETLLKFKWRVKFYRIRNCCNTLYWYLYITKCLLFPLTLFVLANGDTLRDHCSALEVAFVKSYVHGLFESLQTGHYVHKTDVQEAIRLCRETRIEIDWSEYIQVD